MRLRLLALLLTVPIASGCATRGDVQDLQVQIAQMHADQDQLLREIQRQNGVLLDSLNMKDVRLRGDLSNQLMQIERQLVQVQELTGQGQQRLAEFRETLRAREEALARLSVPDVGAAAGDSDELFESAESALQRGSMSTARLGFEEFVTSFPQHPRTPEARLYLGAILGEEGQPEQALEEYARVLELHPDAPEAASALYRAALIEQERGNTDRARAMLNQLTAAYPGSPEAQDAREALRRLR